MPARILFELWCVPVEHIRTHLEHVHASGSMSAAIALELDSFLWEATSVGRSAGHVQRGAVEYLCVNPWDGFWWRKSLMSALAGQVCSALRQDVFWLCHGLQSAMAA